MDTKNEDKMRSIGIQIISDLHLEAPPHYDLFNITPKAPHLALLGDIGNVNPIEHREGLFAFLIKQLRSFHTVLFVPGNHEAFISTWPETISMLKSFEAEMAIRQADDPTLGQFVFMERKRFLFGSFAILGCSLFSRVPEEQAAEVEARMNDFYQTGDGWNVAAHNAAHDRDVNWLNDQVSLAQENPFVRGIIILTHWSPTIDPRACDPKHTGSAISSAFSTDLSGEVCWNAGKVVLWASGHTHFNFDFLVSRGESKGPLRLLANQRGYYFQQAEDFDPEKEARVGAI